MAARPDYLKSVDANSFPYELYAAEPFVPPADYSTEDLWLKPRRRPPTPPTDYTWDAPFSFLSYGEQQNFGNLNTTPYEPPIDYLDSADPFEKRRPFQERLVNSDSSNLKSSPHGLTQRSVERLHEAQQHVQFGDRFTACADCPICKAKAAAERALIEHTTVAANKTAPSSRPVYAAPSPSSQPFGGVQVFPRASANWSRSTSAPPVDGPRRRRISFEEDYVREAPRNRTSSEEEIEEQVLGKYNSVPYQKERRQLAYAEDMAVRKAFMARAVIDRVARSAQELTIFKGEILEVLNDQKSWWKCCNVSGQIGYVPFTLLKAVSKNEAKALSRNRTPEPDYKSNGFSRRTR